MSKYDDIQVAGKAHAKQVIKQLLIERDQLVEALRAMCDRYPEPPGYSTIAGRQARALLAEIDGGQS